MERINLDEALAQYRNLRGQFTKSAADASNPDGTEHPTGSAPDGTQEPKSGERSAENTSDVNDAIAQSVQKAPEPAAKEDSTDAPNYHGAPVLENPQGVPPVTNTPKDPGTESKMDVSTEKSAADEVARIQKLVKEKGAAGALPEVAKSAFDKLASVLNAKPAQNAVKKQAAAAGAAAAQSDLERFFASDENLEMTKMAAAAAEQRGYELAQGFIPFFADMMYKKAMEEGAIPAEAMGGGEGGEMPQDDLGALMAMGAGGDAGGMPPEGDPAAMGDMPPAEGEETGAGGEGAVDPQELVAAISDALDELGISPEQLVELEGDGADAEAGGEAPEEVKEAAMRKAATTAQLVRGYREMVRRFPGQVKRASAHRRTNIAWVVDSLRKKAATIMYVANQRANAARAKR